MLAALLAACSAENAAPAPAAADAAPPAAHASLGAWGVETRFLRPAVAPGDDFYRYVNGGWLETTELPTGFPYFGSFGSVQLRTEAQLKEILADVGTGEWDPSSPQGQINALYRSYLGQDRRDALGVAPLRPDLDAIFGAGSRSELSRYMGGDIAPDIVAIGVGLDAGQPERYVLGAEQSGLGLPGREYYLDEGEPFATVRKAYEVYIARLFELAGIDRGADRARDVLAFETALARAHWTPTEERDRIRNYHLMSTAEFAEFAPGVDWAARFAALGVADQKEIVVATDSAVAAISALFADTPLEVLQSHLAFHLLSDNAPLLSTAFEQANFGFFGTTLSGIPEQRAREDRAIGFLNRSFGEPFGRIYVERYFPESSKVAVEDMAAHMRGALRSRLETLPWMDDATRREALDKLARFNVKVGYPDRWHDYGSLRFSSDDLFGNYRRIAHWQSQEAIARLHEPRRRWEWFLAPQVVNAYYSSTQNEIVFPAAILQAPFFDPGADPAVNFGSAGTVIGHEIGHGFDDQGSRSDGDGRLRDWWTPAAREAFDRRADALAEQYDHFSPVANARVNGRLTLGENIGDLGGMTIAYAAFEAYAAENYPDGAPVLDGFTAEQRFFLGFAQLWRTKATNEFWRRIVLTDPHSPGEFRTNGVVRNFDSWYQAFDVGPDAALYLPPERRVQIW